MALLDPAQAFPGGSFAASSTLLAALQQLGMRSTVKVGHLDWQRMELGPDCCSEAMHRHAQCMPWPCCQPLVAHTLLLGQVPTLLDSARYISRMRDTAPEEALQRCVWVCKQDQQCGVQTQLLQY